jgi:hypothetical protein
MSVKKYRGERFWPLLVEEHEHSALLGSVMQYAMIHIIHDSITGFCDMNSLQKDRVKLHRRIVH